MIFGIRTPWILLHHIENTAVTGQSLARLTIARKRARMQFSEGVRMSRIDIRHPHQRPLKEARSKVESLARKIAERFEVEYGWDGSTLVFERSGVHGEIEVNRGEIHVVATLSFLLFALKGPIEAEIRRYLEAEFD
jgi:putative polyhydroxyalkanoate system protein